MRDGEELVEAKEKDSVEGSGPGKITWEARWC